MDIVQEQINNLLKSFYFGLEREIFVPTLTTFSDEKKSTFSDEFLDQIEIIEVIIL